MDMTQWEKFPRKTGNDRIIAVYRVSLNQPSGSSLCWKSSYGGHSSNVEQNSHASSSPSLIIN